MKKHALLTFALLVSLSMFSQKTYRAMGWKLSRDLPQNEIKVNLGTTIFASHPEVTYERIIDSDFSVGGALGVSLDNDLYPLNFVFIPFVRWFFGGSAENLQKYGAGFFIEANGGLFSTDVYKAFYDEGLSVSYTETGVGAGLGIAIGWKYLSRNNWIGEIYLGGGRDFVNDGGYPRLGITVGKRF